MVQLRLGYWKILVSKNLFQNKVGEWLIGIGFKYDIVVDYLYVDVH